MRSLIALVAGLYSAVAFAADPGAAASCQADLKNLIVPVFKTPMNKKDVAIELTENDGAVYKARLFVPGNSPDNPNKQVAIGWVVLDTGALTASDITSDDEHPEKLKVDLAKYQAYIDKCITHTPAPKTSGNLDGTDLPMTSDALFNCIGDPSKPECTKKFHLLKADAIPRELKNQIDPTMDTFLSLPSAFDMQILLAARTETDVTVDYLYVFQKGKLMSKELLGKSDGTTILTYDINKDYLVTQYERVGEITSKVRKVMHKKLGADGKFVSCPAANPSCK